MILLRAVAGACADGPSSGSPEPHNRKKPESRNWYQPIDRLNREELNVRTGTQVTSEPDPQPHFMCTIIPDIPDARPPIRA